MHVLSNFSLFFMFFKRKFPSYFKFLKKKFISNLVKITTLSNGIKVASVDTGASVSRVSVSTNVGSRHESVTNLGINHLLKNASFLVCIYLFQLVLE